MQRYAVWFGGSILADSVSTFFVYIATSQFSMVYCVLLDKTYNNQNIRSGMTDDEQWLLAVVSHN